MLLDGAEDLLLEQSQSEHGISGLVRVLEGTLAPLGHVRSQRNMLHEPGHMPYDMLYEPGHSLYDMTHERGHRLYEMLAELGHILCDMLYNTHCI